MRHSKSTEMMKKTCKDHFFKAGQWIWLVFMYGIAVIAFSFLTQKSFFAMILLPLVVYGLYRSFMRERLVFKEINYQVVFYVVSAVFTVFIFIIAYSVRVQIFSWDWGKLIRSASEYTLTGKLADATYFARYPNNQFWYCILAIFFGLIHFMWPETGLNEFYLSSIALGCVMTVASILLLHHIAVLIWNEKKAFFVGLMTWFCMPLWLWAMYAYTDIAGMFLLVVMLYCYIKAVLSEFGWKACGWLCLFGVASSVAFSIKVTVFILFIAVFAALLIQKKSCKKIVISIVIVAISFGAGHELCNYVKSAIIPLEESFCDAYEFPLTHWVMMSLGYGGYQQEDVDFTISFDSYEKKKEANIKEIKKRLKARSFHESFKFFGYDKQVRTWGDATFASCVYLYLGEGPQEPDNILKQFVTLKGSKYWMTLLYMTLYYGLILVGMLLSARFAVKRKSNAKAADMPIFVSSITMLGIALFQTIWECNSRYLVVFIPIMILLAADGLFAWRDYIRKGRGVKKIRCFRNRTV